MRDVMGQILGIALAVVLTALALLYPNALGAWRAAIWIGAALSILAVIGLYLLSGKDRAKLYLSGPHLFREPRSKNENRWSMRVHNRGPAAARHVLVRLQSATTPPRFGRWTADYPYPVYPVGTITNDAAQTSSPQRQINPESHEYYEIVRGWETEDGKLNTSLNTKGGGHNDIYIEPDERWRLHYEVTSENADPVHFTLEIFVESNEVKVSKVGLQGAPRWTRWGVRRRA